MYVWGLTGFVITWRMVSDEEKALTQRLVDHTTRRDAFNELVKRYGEMLYRKARAIVITHEDASDVLQNTLVKVWTNLDSFEGRSSLTTWLYRVVINESLDFLRRRKSHGATGLGDASGLASRLMADETFDGDHAQALLQEAMATLPDVQRVVFSLRYYDEMKYSEMSRLLNTSEGGLKASYHIAAKKVADYIKSHV